MCRPGYAQQLAQVLRVSERECWYMWLMRQEWRRVRYDYADQSSFRASLTFGFKIEPLALKMLELP